MIVFWGKGWAEIRRGNCGREAAGRKRNQLSYTPAGLGGTGCGRDWAADYGSNE